jgi:outer membrane protein insertion porin family
MMKSAVVVFRNIVMISALTFFCGAGFGQTEPQSFKLSTIKVTGLKNAKTADVITSSGLSLGQTIKIADLETAVKKLADTGVFTRVGYEYSHDRLKMDLEIQVEEAADFLPGIFDNFVWFSNEALVEAIRAKMPLFQGTFARSGIALPQAIEALQDLLRLHQISGKVRSFPKIDMETRKTLGFLFSITDYPIPVRSIQFRNSTGIPEAELQQKCKSLINQQYSKTFTAEFIQQNLAPLFQQKGYLKVKFRSPEIAILSDATPGTPVNVTVDVVEGRRYQWERALWAGESSIATEELDRILGMKAGDAADAAKISAGLKAVAAAFNKQGYIEARTQAIPEFNDAAGSVQYSARIIQGPQYKMGVVTIKGAPDSIVTKMQSKWKLKEGSLYDPFYFNTFIRQDAIMELASMRPKIPMSRVIPDRANRIVNVSIEFQ